jgi:hypothetical protein
MKRWILAVVVLVTSLTIWAVAGRPALFSDHVDQFSCPTGDGLAARSCAAAEKDCRREGRGDTGARADGEGFSYGYECEGGVLTSFIFSE